MGVGLCRVCLTAVDALGSLSKGTGLKRREGSLPTKGRMGSFSVKSLVDFRFQVVHC